MKKDRHKSLGKEERERMPVKDVWLTPATLSTPRWWKISSTIVIVLVSTASKILLGKSNGYFSGHGMSCYWWV